MNAVLPRAATPRPVLDAAAFAAWTGAAHPDQGETCPEVLAGPGIRHFSLPFPVNTNIEILTSGTVVMLHNPFRPERGRDVIAVTEPLTIRAWLDARRVAAFDRPTICLRNGEPVLRGRWDETLIAENDLVVFVPLPQGGGGGKNPLRTVLMLAVMVAAPYLGCVIAGAVGVTSTIGVSLITAGVAFVGTTLVNVLLPPPKPAAPSFGRGMPSSSPTYSLTAQGNQARLTQPIPVIYGRHRVYPDLAATPWVD